jgi:hypothetical protein
MQDSPLVKDVKKSLEGLKTAAHYLHETGDFIDTTLDDAHRCVGEATRLLESFIRRNGV